MSDIKADLDHCPTCGAPHSTGQQPASLPWEPFIPSQWRGSDSCYPCLVWDKSDDMIFAPCDPWSLPPENDYSKWLCVSMDAIRSLPTAIKLEPKP